MVSPKASTGPNEVGALPAYPDLYRKVAEEQDDIRQLYHLPPEYTKDTYINNQSSECPLIVFVNSRSGGKHGADLTLSFNRRLGRAQVFDLSRDKPDKVLTRLWANFDKAEASGDQAARAYQRKLRIIAAGGDGTIAWVLGTLQSLALDPMPPVAIIPMGTGNDLSRTFGWGAAFTMNWIKSHRNVRSTLQRIAVAEPENLDCWRITLRIPRHEHVGKLPYSLSIAPGDNGDGASTSGATSASGLFWNYMSVGLDAKAAYGFHSLRDHPGWGAWLTAGRLTNQLWYSVFSCTSGWFCCTKSLTSKVSLAVRRPGSDAWEEVAVPHEVKALVVLNLQSYAGGRNLWGGSKPKLNSDGKATFQEPSYRDGLLEVVGLTSGYHTGLVMASKGALVHARRLCQASALRLRMRAQHTRPDGTPSHAYLQIDGEPWIQDVPSGKDSEPIVVEVASSGVSSKVLKNRAGLHPAHMDRKFEVEMERSVAALAGPARPQGQGVGRGREDGGSGRVHPP